MSQRLTYCYYWIWMTSTRKNERYCSMYQADHLFRTSICFSSNNMIHEFRLCRQICVIRMVDWRSFVSDQFLYLSDSRILSLPSFEEVTCKQDFPENPLQYATAGVVMDGNLLVCGGRGMTTCRIWTEKGWLEKGTGFNRYYKRGSEYLYRPYSGFHIQSLFLDYHFFQGQKKF